MPARSAKYFAIALSSKRAILCQGIRIPSQNRKWNPKSPTPFIKLGEVLEKKDDPYRAAQAYRRFVELAPNDKHVGELRKKIEKLEKEAEK